MDNFDLNFDRCMRIFGIIEIIIKLLEKDTKCLIKWCYINYGLYRISVPDNLLIKSVYNNNYRQTNIPWIHSGKLKYLLIYEISNEFRILLPIFINIQYMFIWHISETLLLLLLYHSLRWLSLILIPK